MLLDCGSSSRVDDGSWHHVVISHERWSDKIRTYLDGSELGYANCPSSGTFDINLISVGYDEYSGGRYHFDGMIDDVRFYDSTFIYPTIYI